MHWYQFFRKHFKMCSQCIMWSPWTELLGEKKRNPRWDKSLFVFLESLEALFSPFFGPYAAASPQKKKNPSSSFLIQMWAQCRSPASFTRLTVDQTVGFPSTFSCSLHPRSPRPCKGRVKVGQPSPSRGSPAPVHGWGPRGRPDRKPSRTACFSVKKGETRLKTKLDSHFNLNMTCWTFLAKKKQPDIQTAKSRGQDTMRWNPEKLDANTHLKKFMETSKPGGEKKIWHFNAPLNPPPPLPVLSKKRRKKLWELRDHQGQLISQGPFLSRRSR